MSGGSIAYLGISQQAVDQMMGKAVEAKAPSGDNGKAAGHRFKNRHTPSLIAGGEQEAIMPTVQIRQVDLCKKKAPMLANAVALHAEDGQVLKEFEGRARVPVRVPCFSQCCGFLGVDLNHHTQEVP